MSFTDLGKATGLSTSAVHQRVRRLEPGEARVRLGLARRVLSLGKWIFIRTAALTSAFALAGAVATRSGDDAIAAHQIAFQLFFFLALVLDSIAIAGQIIVGRELGSGRTERAYEAGERMIWLSVALGAAFALGPRDRLCPVGFHDEERQCGLVGRHVLPELLEQAVLDPTVEAREHPLFK
jgi:hypothetical protein